MLPRSFKEAGFDMATIARKGGNKFRRLLIGTDGLPDTGKTEFAMSAPGPGMGILLDRGFEACFDNTSPPPARQEDWGFQVVKCPMASQSNDPKFYLEYWQAFYKVYLAALNNVDSRAVLVDGDSDSWELQKLAAFGKLTQIPPLQYTNVNAARRAMYARAWDSGKIVIATNKVKAEYQDEVDSEGKPRSTDGGAPVRKPTGEVERQGFKDQAYLFQIQLRHFIKPAVNGTPTQYGIRIMKCKANNDLIGTELIGPDCNFAGLVSLVYPEVSLEEWGFK